MAYFARVDDGLVTSVLSIPDDQEHRGQEFLADDLQLGGVWIQTSYNARIRKNYASIGFSYDAELDAFIPPKPFASWVLDVISCRWKAPIPYPEDGLMYQWNEIDEDWEPYVGETDSLA